MTKCVRKYFLWKLPKVLIIHLKRFQMTTYSKKKLDTKVKIP